MTSLEIINKANQAIYTAAKKISNDPLRPNFHFLPPAQWINDPNGTHFHNGYFHVFYQTNPYGDAWDHIHWGYARTKDFNIWERFSVVLAPDINFLHEEHCYSGGATITQDNKVMLAYTSVPKLRDTQAYTQVLLELSKVDEHNKTQFILKRLKNHLITTQLDTLNLIDHHWKDPFFYRKNGKNFLILGGNLKENNVPCAICLEASDHTLLNWEFKSIMKTFEKSIFQAFTNPNMFQLINTKGDILDILIGSQYQPVNYYLGNLDTDTGLFETISEGIINNDITYYATNYFTGHKNRNIIVSRIGKFPKGRGWDGCHSIPREIGIDDDNIIIQTPIEELKQLRLNEYKIEFNKTIYEIKAPDCHCMEFQFFIPLDGYLIITDNNNEEIIAVRGEQLVYNKYIKHQIISRRHCTHTQLHIFFDQSIIECFVNQGSVSLVRVSETLHLCEYITIMSNKETTGKAWSMRSLKYIDSY